MVNVPGRGMRNFLVKERGYTQVNIHSRLDVCHNK
jgi:hypothetical protein